MRDRTHLTRQLDIIPLECLDTPVTIIGAGAIGSWVTLCLAKMGMENITVMDDDVVSIENMNSQFYPFSAIGKPKAKALHDMVKSFTGIKISYSKKRYESGKIPGVVVCAVDSMKARRAVYDHHAERSLHTKLIIDPRMGSESALLYAYNPMSSEECAAYATSLYSDESAVQERCTAKATIYTANLLAGLVVKSIKDHLTKSQQMTHATWDIRSNHLLCFIAAPKTGSRSEGQTNTGQFQRSGEIIS